MNLEKFWKGFQHPPKDCSQSPFWFLNGEVDGGIYSAQMDKMADQGVCQAMPHPRFGMDRREYLTEHYFQEFQKMAENAREKGYLINLYDEFNWSSGNAGGQLTENPKNCALGIAVGYARASHRFTYDRWEDGFMGWAKKEDVLLVGYAPFHSETEICLDECTYSKDYTLKENVLQLSLPEGDWLAFVIYTVRTQHPSPLRQGNGSIVDYLNPDITKRFIQLTHEAYYEHLGEYFGNTIPSIFYDEVSPYASGNFSWTEKLPQLFQNRNGYSILEKLPLLFFDGGSETPKVRCDYWDTVTECFADSFVGPLADWCANHGIALTGHSHEDSALWPTCGDLFRNLRPQQWTGLDSLNGYKPYSALKPAISVAHAAGRNVVLCEALGLLHGWSCSPSDMKKAYNQLAIAGVNLLVPHGFFQTVDNPKVECPPSFFDCNPYWQYYRQISSMTDRQCYINRKMAHIADAAVFYPIVSWWAGGRGGRGRAFPWGIDSDFLDLTRTEFEQYDTIMNTMMSNQLDFDVIDSVALQQEKHEGKTVSFGTEHYQVLILPTMSTIRLSDAQKILELAESGVPVVTVGQFAPASSVEHGMGDPVLAEIIEKLQPHLHTAVNMECLAETVRQLIPADVIAQEENRPFLDTAHRHLDGLDLYLLFHTGNKGRDVQLSVRCTRKEVSLLNAEGNQIPAHIWEEDHRTFLRFHALPEEMYYFVLSDKAIPVHASEQPVNLVPAGVLNHFMFMPLAGNRDSFQDGQKEVELAVPTCKTTAKPYESGQGNELANFWRNWMQPDFPDDDWEVLSLKRGSKLYDHTGSRFFRFEIPAGTTAIQKPIPINGEYALYVNGRLLETVTEFVSQDAEWLPIAGCEEKPGILAIESSSMMPQFGLLKPPVFRVQSYQTLCRDWRELGLGWYSGFGVYETEIESDGQALWLDLGDVRECAEIIVNGKPLKYQVWSPYLFNLTPALQTGKNKIQIICCNLISNEYSWDPLGTRGGGERLPSGILGPVTLWKEE